MLSRILFLLKAFLKGCYINKPSKLVLSKTSWIGKHVSIFTEREAFVKLGDHTRIGHFSELNPTGDGIEIKDFATINTGCKIIGEITIERYSLLSANIFMSSGNHQARLLPHLLIRTQDELSRNTQLSKPIHIEEDVWIGVGVFIKQGVTIGRGAIIGANSVVLTGIAPYEIYAGNPAQKKGERLRFNPKPKISSDNPEDLPYFYRGFDHIHFNPGTASKPGIVAYRESVVAIPSIPFKKVIVCGSLCNGINEVLLEISLSPTLSSKHQIRTKTFTIEIDYADRPISTGADNHKTSYSFITFAAKLDYLFGLHSIELIY